MMLWQYLRKKAKILIGLYGTHIRGLQTAYADRWWDEDFFTDEISDRSTIWSGCDPLLAAYHYASVELQILRYLHGARFRPEGVSVCDLGSGAGHWIDFYLSLGAARAIGVDLSAKSFTFLQGKYQDDARVDIFNGRAVDALSRLEQSADLVSAIGVMFHLIDDGEWRDTIRQSARALRPGGMLVVGGYFGWLDGVNVQFASDGSVNKRLRSAAHWRRELRAAGFDDVTIRKNRAYLHIGSNLPENNLLFAKRAGVLCQ